MAESPYSSPMSCETKGSAFSTWVACASAAIAEYSVCSQTSFGKLAERRPEPAVMTGCSNAVAMIERIPCTPTSVTARSMLSTGRLLVAIDRAVRDAQQVAGERRILRDDARHLGHGRFVVVDRRHQLRQQRRPPRNVFGTRFDAFEDLLHGFEYRRVFGVGRPAQRLARHVVERIGHEPAQRLVPAQRCHGARRAECRSACGSSPWSMRWDRPARASAGWREAR